MAVFLSDEWIAALAGACGDVTAAPGADADRLVVEPVVIGVPGRGDVRYRISFAAESCRVEGAAADSASADVRLETDYVVAVALARGEMNAQAALADGRLRISGDLARLAAHGSALARLGDLFAAVRAATTYPARPEPIG